MSEYMIEVKDLKKTFREQVALDTVSLQIPEGEIFGITGRNGSGKTVLMKCICGLMYPDSGEIRIHGTALKKGADLPVPVGAIIETPGFLPGYSGMRNLSLLAGIRSNIDKNTIRNAMQIVGLNPDERKHVSKYSLGMRQRLGIAQAIMEDPALLILDEPFNGLDEEGVGEIRELLLKLKKQGKTILLSSHNSEDIEILCDHVCHMEHGKMEQVR